MDLLKHATEALIKAIDDNKVLSKHATYLTFSEEQYEREDGIFLQKYADKEENRLKQISSKPQFIINATPHEINVYDLEMNRFYPIPASGILPRVSKPLGGHESQETVFFLDGARTMKVKMETERVGTMVEGLPKAQEGVFYVVSALVRSACPERTDLLQVIPHRNEEGVIIGALGFTRNLV